MTLLEQAKDSGSPLCRFLDARLPMRSRVVEAWAGELEASSRQPELVDADAALLGQALEVRIGLDLADEPGYPDLLGFLPPDRFEQLLVAAGFAQPEDLALPAVEVADPILRAWVRACRPDDPVDGEPQQAALRACLDAVFMDAAAHAFAGDGMAVQTRRAWMQRLRPGGSTSMRSAEALRGLTRLWDRYITYGRGPLVGFGSRVCIAPVLAPGFAVADLVVGRTLVEVKASSVPSSALPVWVNQVLGYLLLDRWDVFGLDTVALYSGWHAEMLTVPVQRLLAMSSAGQPPSLAPLREDFHDAMRESLQGAFRSWQERRYPPAPRRR